MNLALAVSVGLHAAILAWALLHIGAPPLPKPAEPEPVEVAMISEDGLTRLKRGSREAKQLEAAQKDNPLKDTKKEAPKPKVAPTALPPPPAAEPPPPPVAEPVKSEPPKEPDKLAALSPPPAAPPPPPPDAVLEAQKKLEDDRKADEERKAEEDRKAEEQRKADEQRQAEDERRAEDEKRKAEEKKKAEDEQKRKELEKKKADEQKKKLAEAKRKADEAKKKFDTEKISALLNKIPDKSAPAGADEFTPSKNKGPVAGAPEGRDSRLTASQAALLGSMMKRAVSRCWNINSGLEGIDRVVVKIEVMLTPDGRLAQPPRIANSGPGPLFSDAANSAIRAIVQCEPYDMPTELYKGGWDHMVVTFDPQRMF